MKQNKKTFSNDVLHYIFNALELKTVKHSKAQRERISPMHEQI